MTSSKPSYLGAVDQGTTSTRFVIVDHRGRIAAMHQLEHRQIYPKPGWVEHDPIEIRDNMYRTIDGALDKAGLNATELAAIGITNQRETTVVWNKKTGEPYYNAIVWQDTRTDTICRDLGADRDIDKYREIVGLPLATYFSGPKVKWILDNVKGTKEAAKQGDLLFGNIDAWLIWWLTGGPTGGVHVTDVTNASRTFLYNLTSLDWDERMLSDLEIPAAVLPSVKSSSEIYGETAARGRLSAGIPVSGALGDQQAALFGQTCFNPGEAKNTYGTGCFMLLNTGERIVQSKRGLITTLGYQIGAEPAVYALEGSIAIAGSLVQWMRDNLGLIASSSDINALAETVDDNGGVYFVPAFSGLFAPHWRSDARGIIAGLTHYAGRGHLARAVLEATAFQTADIFAAMKEDSAIELNTLKVDGGMVASELLMQFQADILDVPVIRPKTVETSVLGAAYAAGLAVGFWQNQKELKDNWAEDKIWRPAMSRKLKEQMYSQWQKAVERSLSWI